MTIPDDEDDTMIVLSPDMLGMDPVLCDVGGEDKKYSKLFDDMFYRPHELEGCAPGIFSDIIPRRKNPSRRHNVIFTLVSNLAILSSLLTA